MHGIPVDELDRAHFCIGHVRQLASDHIENIFMREKCAREMEADRQRPTGWFLGELDNGSCYAALADTEDAHSIDRRRNYI